MPERIQRKRTRGWKMPEGTVYVGRPTKWGNPWRVVPVRDHHFPWGEAADVINVARSASVGRFSRYSRSPGTGAPYWACHAFLGGLTEEFKETVRAELAGRDLACWCPPPAKGQPDYCHGAVLLRVASGEKWPL